MMIPVQTLSGQKLPAPNLWEEFPKLLEAASPTPPVTLQGYRSENEALLTHCFKTSGLQNCEEMNFSCLKPLICCDSLSWQPQALDTGK